MKNELMQAHEVLQREAKRLEQLANAAKVLGDAGAILARVEEGEKILKDLQQKTTAARAEHDQAKKEVEDQRDLALATASKAEEEAKRVVEDAKKRADNIVRFATDEAASAKAKAQAEAQKLTDEAKAMRRAAEASKKEADAAVEKAAREVAEKTKELAALQDKIAKARAEAARIIG